MLEVVGPCSPRDVVSRQQKHGVEGYLDGTATDSNRVDGQKAINLFKGISSPEGKSFDPQSYLDPNNYTNFASMVSSLLAMYMIKIYFQIQCFFSIGRERVGDTSRVITARGYYQG